MPGKITHQPHSYLPGVYANNALSINKQPLKNALTGQIIHVKQTHADFRVLKKELSLFRAVKENPMLASIANIGAQTSQTARLHALGMAVTVVSNMGDSGVAKEKADILCDTNPRNPSADIYFDGAINKRGQDFIQGFVNNETPLDSTIYATGLKMGTEVKQLDPFMAQRFDALWCIRLNQISQAPDRE